MLIKHIADPTALETASEFEQNCSSQVQSIAQQLRSLLKASVERLASDEETSAEIPDLQAIVQDLADALAMPDDE